jgi:sensor histidine kinase YesM
LEVENKIPVHNVQIPSLLLQPLVENAINHGLFHKEKGGLLILKFLQGSDNHELICIIEDNGIGRERSGAINKDIVDRRESYGTKLTQQLIQIYREYEHMHIFMEYTDKTEPETGTVVKLTIKNVKYIG